MRSARGPNSRVLTRPTIRNLSERYTALAGTRWKRPKTLKPRIANSLVGFRKENGFTSLSLIYDPLAIYPPPEEAGAAGWWIQLVYFDDVRIPIALA